MMGPAARTAALLVTFAWASFARADEPIERGRALYFGKGFCAACHGQDGKGLGADIGTTKLRGALPTDFTDREWQRSRSDDELLSVLRKGSPGTAMAPFVPLILSEEEARQVIRYVRSLASEP